MDFSPFQVAVAAASALVVLGIGLWGFEMGPSPELIVQQRRKPVAGLSKSEGGKDGDASTAAAAQPAAAIANKPMINSGTSAVVDSSAIRAPASHAAASSPTQTSSTQKSLAPALMSPDAMRATLASSSDIAIDKSGTSEEGD